QRPPNRAKTTLPPAPEAARGALATALLRGAAAAVAAAAGAIEAESASFAIDKIDQSIAKYSETLASRGGKDTQS
ncbi:hypothetical protein I5F81_29880, partial [Pseudomonas aeruginosa]|nr:hypothetical protein [Pseudomonas aeruginosa]